MFGCNHQPHCLSVHKLVHDKFPRWVQEFSAAISNPAAAGQLEVPHTMQQQMQPANNGVLPVAEHTQGAQAALAPYLELLQHASVYVGQASPADHGHATDAQNLRQHHTSEATDPSQIMDAVQLLQHTPHNNEDMIHSQHPVTAMIDAAAEWVDQSLEDRALLPGHSGDARSHLAAASPTEGDAEAWEWLQAANVAGVAARRLQQDTNSVTSTLLQVSISDLMWF